MKETKRRRRGREREKDRERDELRTKGREKRSVVEYQNRRQPLCLYYGLIERNPGQPQVEQAPKKLRSILRRCSRPRPVSSLQNVRRRPILLSLSLSLSLFLSASRFFASPFGIPSIRGPRERAPPLFLLGCSRVVESYQRARKNSLLVRQLTAETAKSKFRNKTQLSFQWLNPESVTIAIVRQESIYVKPGDA